MFKTTLNARPYTANKAHQMCQPVRTVRRHRQQCPRHLVLALRAALDRLVPTIADAILDRIIHNAHRIELKGDSMRRKNENPGLTQTENPEIITEEA